MSLPFQRVLVVHTDKALELALLRILAIAEYALSHEWSSLSRLTRSLMEKPLRLLRMIAKRMATHAEHKPSLSLVMHGHPPLPWYGKPWYR